MKIILTIIASSIVLLIHTSSIYAALLTFDDQVNGTSSYSYDGDDDGNDDVVFSTTSPMGFSSVGPGPNMSFINEPGIVGMTNLNPDLRVDFTYGGVDNLTFSFAISFTMVENQYGVNFTIYDSNDVILATTHQTAGFTKPDGQNNSDYPEAVVSLDFSGTASYALFDFDSEAYAYIIDNFTGTFGSKEVVSNEVKSRTASIPTLTDYGIILLFLCLSFAGLSRIRTNRVKPCEL